MDPRKRANTATVMYAETPVCAFCLQFFYTDETHLSPGESRSIASIDSFGKYMVESSFNRKPVERTSSVARLISPPPNARFKALSPVKIKSSTVQVQRPRTSPANVNLARTLGHQAEAKMLQLDNEPSKPGSIHEKPVKRLSHYHSPSFPARQLNESSRIPKRAVASHGWGLDGNVDDVFYAGSWI